MRRMLTDQEDVYYYITLMNENYAHPDMPPGAEAGIIKGMYHLRDADSPPAPGTALNIIRDDAASVDASPLEGGGRAGAARAGGGARVKTAKGENPRAQLLGSGTILREVLAAAELLDRDFNVKSDVWSCPSFTELRRDGANVERWNRLNPESKPRKAWITQCLEGRGAVAIAATDYVRSYTEQVRAYLPKGLHYVWLGTDGIGRSDTRANLLRFFEVDRYWIAHATVAALADEGLLMKAHVTKAIQLYGLDAAKPNPATV